MPSQQADDAELDALLDVIASHRRGLVEFVPALLGDDPEVGMDRLALRCGQRGIPLTWTGFTVTETNPAFTERWLEVMRGYHAQGFQVWPQLSPRTVDFRLNWDSSMMFMSMPSGWNRVIQARGDEKRRLLADADWRVTARNEWDNTPKAMFPNTRIDRVRIVEVTNPDDERWLGRSLADLVAERGGHPSDVLADLALANDCRPGIVAVGVANADTDSVARTMVDDRVLISSSDAGAHLQMLCASGDTTLLLTRHVRERGDFTLEQAIYELTGRQADAFGFRDRGVIEPGRAGDVAVFALDDLHWDDDVFVADFPGGASRLRRPEGRLPRHRRQRNPDPARRQAHRRAPRPHARRPRLNQRGRRTDADSRNIVTGLKRRQIGGSRGDFRRSGGDRHGRRWRHRPGARVALRRRRCARRRQRLRR